MHYNRKNNKNDNYIPGLDKMPALLYLKDPVATISELYSRYPDGGEYGWYAFVTSKGTFAAWSIDTNRWNLISSDTVSIRKMYVSYDLMISDIYPADDETKELLKFGQLVAINDESDTSKNGIYRFTEPGWQKIDRLGDLSTYAKKDDLNIISQEVKDKFPITLNDLAESTKQYIDASQGGIITNFPDEEDITVNAENQLRLRDKTFSPATFSGRGRIFLRRNIMSGKNLLLQSMVTEPNTIYNIQYDYNLDGGVLYMPVNCVLNFTGGSIRNGTIVFSNTRIVGDSEIFTSDVRYAGKLNGVFESDWIGLTDGVDNTDKLLAIVNFANNTEIPRIRLQPGHFYANKSLVIENSVELDGCGCTLDFSNYTEKEINLHITSARTRQEAQLTLIEDLKKGNRTIKSNSELPIGAVFVWNTDPNSYPDREYYYQGEIINILKKEGSEYVIETPVYGSYTTGDNIRINTVQWLDNVKIKNLSIITKNFGAETSPVSLALENCKNGIVENVNTYESNNAGIHIKNCFRMKVKNCICESFTETGIGLNYGIVVGNSQEISVSDCTCNTFRHGIDTGGGDYPSFIPVVNRLISISECEVKSTSYIAAMNFHGNTEYSVVSDCRIIGGLSVNGRYNRYISNYIISGDKGFKFQDYEYAPAAVTVTGFDLSHYIVGNYIEQLAPSRYGAVYVSSGVGKENSLDISNNIIINESDVESIRVIVPSNNSDSVIIISNNSIKHCYDSNKRGVYFSSGYLDKVIVNNNSIENGGVYFAVPYKHAIVKNNTLMANGKDIRIMSAPQFDVVVDSYLLVENNTILDFTAIGLQHTAPSDINAREHINVILRDNVLQKKGDNTISPITLQNCYSALIDRNTVITELGDSIRFNYVNKVFCGSNSFPVSVKSPLVTDVLEFVSIYAQNHNAIPPALNGLPFYSDVDKTFKMYVDSGLRNLNGSRIDYSTTIGSLTDGQHIGDSAYITTRGRMAFWNGTKWVDGNNQPAGIPYSGATASRPADVVPGFMYIDTTLNKPVFWTGNNWIDATGAVV